MVSIHLNIYIPLSFPVKPQYPSTSHPTENKKNTPFSAPQDPSETKQNATQRRSIHPHRTMADLHGFVVWNETQEEAYGSGRREILPLKRLLFCRKLSLGKKMDERYLLEISCKFVCAWISVVLNRFVVAMGNLQVCFQERACTNVVHTPIDRLLEWMRAWSL